MRVIETIHPNLQCRTFTCDFVINPGPTMSDISLPNRENTSGPEVKLFDTLNKIPLLSRPVYVSKYSIDVSVEEAFEDDKDLWDKVRLLTLSAIASFLKVETWAVSKVHSVKDTRLKYDKPAVDLMDLYDIVSKVAIPHDFETHREAWRSAIADKVSSYSELDDPEGRHIYWKNELEKFDAAFAALLALRLPQS